MATAGLICGVFAIALTLLIVALAAAGIAWLSKTPSSRKPIEDAQRQQQMQQGQGQPARHRKTPGPESHRAPSTP
jgi:hypothetical protein